MVRWLLRLRVVAYGHLVYQRLLLEYESYECQSVKQHLPLLRFPPPLPLPRRSS